MTIPLCVSAATASTYLPAESATATQEQSLAEAALKFERQSGITIHLAPAIAQDNITRTVNESDLKHAIENLLADYNHIDILDGNGQLKRVLVTGHKGNGAGQAAKTGASVPPPATASRVEGLTLGPAVTTGLPEKYYALKPGSVYHVTIDTAALKAVKIGENISMFLPDGQHQIVHDNRFEHDNGDLTWAGYSKSFGKNYRFIVTLGQKYTVGQILTITGQYQLEQQGDQHYLVDIKAAGMKEITDTHKSLDTSSMPVTKTLDAFLRGDWAQQLLNSLNPIQAAEATGNIITLMALYTPGLAGIESCAAPAAAVTRINNLVALTNQAYIDSAVNITLQLVRTKCIGSYTNDNDNSEALGVLTKSGLGNTIVGFPNASGTPNVATTRNKVKADLVTLIRPFVYPTQASCGVGWQNNALSADLAFSVVSDGNSGEYYCTDYTLAHELGHTMGSAHGNTAATGNTGIFASSYGFGIDGVFGTIMSYFSPRVGVFSNPKKTCPGSNPCGVKGTNNNARSLNTVAPTIAVFR